MRLKPNSLVETGDMFAELSLAANLGIFTTGLLLLYFGAEALVGGSSTIALTYGVKPLVVGLTVVAFGTSSPELLVCLTAAIESTSATDAISIGNILGSNIANIVLILGCASLLRPIRVTNQAVRQEYPIMLAATGLLVALIYFDSGEAWLTRIDGAILTAGMVSYLLYSYLSAGGTNGEVTPEELEEVEATEMEESSVLPQLGKIVLGIVGLAMGAWGMVESSVAIARDLQVPEIAIGISIVAFGTSLPELATSVVAAIRDEADISVGNVIGSNIFNIMLVLGTVSLIAPISVDPSVLRFDLWVMVGVAVGIWPILESGKHINRIEGVGMLVLYAGYIALLFMRESAHIVLVCRPGGVAHEPNRLTFGSRIRILDR